MVDKVDKIWLDGKLVPWDEARVHVLTHTLHYGLGVFEGIRCYKRDDGKSAVFRLREHVQRLLDSAKIATIPVPYSIENIEQACLETIRANKLDECYIRPLIFLGDETMGLLGKGNSTRMTIAVWRWGAYLGEEGLKKGIRAKVSSYARPGVNMLMAKGKIVGHYVNSILAKREVVATGYDEAILLDAQGYLAEASGENVFVIRGKHAFTPTYGASLLGGITRDSVITLFKEIGITVEERLISRDELYTADEVLMCGTAAEVTPVREIDDRIIGSGERGPITKAVQDRFFAAARGREVTHPEWLTFV